MLLASLLVPLTTGICPAQRVVQSHVPELFPERDARAIQWPAHIPSLEKGRMVIGDVTGDLQPDAVLLNGGFPVVAYAPAIHQTLFEIQVAANDIAVLPASEPGRAQTLVLAGPGGLSLLSDFAAGQFAQVHAGSSAWLAAERVRVADTNKDGRADLVGLSAADELLFLEDPSDPLPIETILPIGGAVLDFVPIDWDGAGSSELRVAVLTNSGLSIRSQAGAVLFAIVGQVDGGALTVLRQAGVPFERLALVYEASGTQFLLVLDRTGVEAPISLATDLVFALAAADANLDANDDLYLLHHFSHDSALFLNQSTRPRAATTFGFGLGKIELVDVAPTLAPSPLWSAWPGLADLSLDGDPEAVVLVEASNELVFIENTRRDLARRQVEVLGGAYAFDESLDQGELRLDLTQPQTLAFVPTHIEIVGWKQADAIDGGLEAGPSAVIHALCALEPDGSATCRIPVHEVDLFTPNIYHFDLRAVRVEAEAVVSAGPSAVHAFTTPELLVDALEAEFGEGVELRVFVIEDGVERELSAAELADRQLAPKAVKTDKIPEMPSAPNPFD